MVVCCGGVFSPFFRVFRATSPQEYVFKLSKYSYNDFSSDFIVFLRYFSGNKVKDKGRRPFSLGVMATGVMAAVRFRPRGRRCWPWGYNLRALIFF